MIILIWRSTLSEQWVGRVNTFWGSHDRRPYDLHITRMFVAAACSPPNLGSDMGRVVSEPK